MNEWDGKAYGDQSLGWQREKRVDRVDSRGGMISNSEIKPGADLIAPFRPEMRR